jgi:hypothetical protein
MWRRRRTLVANGRATVTGGSQPQPCDSWTNASHGLARHDPDADHHSDEIDLLMDGGPLGHRRGLKPAPYTNLRPDGLAPKVPHYTCRSHNHLEWTMDRRRHQAARDRAAAIE